MAKSTPLRTHGISFCYWIMAEETVNYFKNLSPLKILFKRSDLQQTLGLTYKSLLDCNS